MPPCELQQQNLLGAGVAAVCELGCRPCALQGETGPRGRPVLRRIACLAPRWLKPHPALQGTAPEHPAAAAGHACVLIPSLAPAGALPTPCQAARPD